ncbi:MAG: 5-(carboxyamino)imidazole ribonucleotide synthase [Ketobacteraceae bacterium]|nr:5-(carboxyamino)imidazole ribonucleotide synthase [Ketobacteraceae bacterium]
MRVAVFGVGQLARMMAQAAPEDVTFSFIRMQGESTACVEGLGDIITLEEHQNAAALYEALGRPAVVTVEKEAVPVDSLRALQAYCAVHPSPDAVEVTQHRGREKQFLSDHQIGTTRFAVVDAAGQLKDAAAGLARPLFAKSMTSGYDGKNQWLIKTDQDLEALAGAFPDGGVILEEMVSFTREVSFIAVRNTAGDIRFYPGVENLHRGGILVKSVAPAKDLSNGVRDTAQSWLRRLLETWDYVGVLTMECFETDQGLLVNELAPRVHNSGHWTMQSGITSQFANHILAILGRPLGNTQVKEHYGMVNILGEFSEAEHRELLSQTRADLHWYNKSAKPKRKLGHLNCHDASRKALEMRLNRLLEALHPARPGQAQGKTKFVS